MCTTLARTERTSRKRHACVWCGEDILPKDTYVEVRVVNDEACCVDTNRFHPECDDDLHDVASRERGGCYYFTPFENPRPVRIT